MKPELRDQIIRERRQYAIWAAGFLARLRRGTVPALTHRYIPDFIGTLTREPDGRWRLATWRPNGPNGHEIYNDDQLAHEVYHQWRADPEAPARLDSWVNTPAWVLGMQQLDYLDLWNGYSFAGNSAACHAMDEAFAAGGLEAGIRKGRELTR